MAQGKYTNGTLFMALEEGAAWPRFMRQLRKAAANVQAVVQAPGEPTERFTARVLDRWNAVVGTSAPPHRFVLGTNASWDTHSTLARQHLARLAMSAKGSLGSSELILWAGSSDDAEAQSQLLALAGALVEGKGSPSRRVRVLFREPAPLTERMAKRQSDHSALRVA